MTVAVIYVFLVRVNEWASGWGFSVVLNFSVMTTMCLSAGRISSALLSGAPCIPHRDALLGTPNKPSNIVTLYWHRADQSFLIPVMLSAKRPRNNCHCWSLWSDSTPAWTWISQPRQNPKLYPPRPPGWYISCQKETIHEFFHKKCSDMVLKTFVYDWQCCALCGPYCYLRQWSLLQFNQQWSREGKLKVNVSDRICSW